jgi:hypothetical protein
MELARVVEGAGFVGVGVGFWVGGGGRARSVLSPQV